jgi:hypothetical protein
VAERDQVDEVVGPPWRPRASIEKLRFNDGTEITLGRHEVVVFVGPNNSGKSAALRDISLLLGSAGSVGMVVKSLAVLSQGNHENVTAWAERCAIRIEGGVASRAFWFPGFQLHESNFQQWNASDSGLQSFAPFLTTTLSTEARLSTANQTNTVGPGQISTHPLHLLYEDDELEARVSGLFHQAFGSDLVINRGAGPATYLHLGKRPVVPQGTDRVSKAYRQAVHDLPQLQLQGDGVRAFTGVLLQTLALDKDIVIIDEPEAFLHPPQAVLLGKMLSKELPWPRQLIVATHSSDFLRGVLDAPNSSVRVIRLRREGPTNRTTVLDPAAVKSVWQDPLLRYSKILDGLFHDGVIVCEGDGDCRFYGAMMDAVASEQPKPDLHLVHGGGKTRLVSIVKALRAIGVPIRVVADFDLLSEEHVLRGLVESLAGDWSALVRDWMLVKSTIESLRPALPKEIVKQRILECLERNGSANLTEDTIKAIRKILQGASAWLEVKRAGKSFLPSGQVTVAYGNLAAALREMGIHLVEVGELERFCPGIDEHGPRWVQKVLERPLADDPELETARAFARGLLAGW